jgi:hypothetical protein
VKPEAIGFLIVAGVIWSMLCVRFGCWLERREQIRDCEMMASAQAASGPAMSKSAETAIRGMRAAEAEERT